MMLLLNAIIDIALLLKQGYLINKKIHVEKKYLL